MTSEDDHIETKNQLKLNILAWIFFIAGIVLINRFLIVEPYYAFTSQTWPKAAGQVIHVEEIVETGFRAGFPYPKITYQYGVGDQIYRNHWIRFGYNKVHNGNHSDAEALRDAFPKNTPVTVYYDPESPKRSVLKPGEWPLIDLIFLIPIALCFYLFYGLRNWLNS